MKFGYKYTKTACYLGYVTQAIINNFAPLLFLIFQNEYTISLPKITLLIAINFTVQLTVDLLSAGFADKIGYRASIIAAHIFAAVGIGGMAVLPDLFGDPYIGLLISVVIYAVGGGLTEVLISPIIEACPTENKSSEMSLLHSFYCWGSAATVLLSTLFFVLCGKENWRILALLWAVLPTLNAVLFAFVPIGKLTENGEGMKLRELMKDCRFILLALMIFAAGASELAMSQWASSFAEKGLGVSKTVGDLLGPCLFAVLMGSARVFYAKAGEKLDLLKYICGCCGLCAASYLLAALSPIPVLSLLGCGICGFSVGVMWPGVFSIASERFPKGGTAMFAILALAGDLGCSGGPALVGTVSKHFGDKFRPGLLSAVVFPIILIVCAVIYRKRSKKG
ncbi:MAG: MFS transporter [Oscillospiraceae bacterium]